MNILVSIGKTKFKFSLGFKIIFRQHVIVYKQCTKITIKSLEMLQKQIIIIRILNTKMKHTNNQY